MLANELLPKNFVELQNTFNTIGISFTTATLNTDAFKKVIYLSTTAKFIFNSRGKFVEALSRGPLK